MHFLCYFILTYRHTESAKLLSYQKTSKRLKKCLDFNVTSYIQDSLLPQTRKKKKKKEKVKRRAKLTRTASTSSCLQYCIALETNTEGNFLLLLLIISFNSSKGRI